MAGSKEWEESQVVRGQGVEEGKWLHFRDSEFEMGEHLKSFRSSLDSWV